MEEGLLARISDMKVQQAGRPAVSAAGRRLGSGGWTHGNSQRSCRLSLRVHITLYY